MYLMCMRLWVLMHNACATVDQPKYKYMCLQWAMCTIIIVYWVHIDIKFNDGCNKMAQYEIIILWLAMVHSAHMFISHNVQLIAQL